MRENIQVLGPFLIVIAYCLLLWLIFRACGLTWLRWQINPERVKPWRRFRRWQFVIVYGIGTLTAPLLLYLLSYDFLERRWAVYYTPAASHVVLVWLVCVLLGVGQGWSTWKKIWKHEYDLPS